MACSLSSFLGILTFPCLFLAPIAEPIYEIVVNLNSVQQVRFLSFLYLEVNMWVLTTRVDRLKLCDCVGFAFGSHFY